MVWRTQHNVHGQRAVLCPPNHEQILSPLPLWLWQEYLVECRKCRFSLSSFAAVTPSVAFPSSSLVLHSCTCTFSDLAQGLLCKYIHCRLCSMQVILCYPFPRVHLVRTFFIKFLPLVQLYAFLGKSFSYFVQCGH